MLAGKVLLLKNDRAEWELPGGRIEPGETPQECVAREITEETRLTARTGPLLDTWLHHITQVDKHIFIVTYGCHSIGTGEPVISGEHTDIGLFTPDRIAGLVMPDGYKRSIAAWFSHPAFQ